MTAQHKTIAMAVLATLGVIWALNNVEALEPAKEFILED